MPKERRFDVTRPLLEPKQLFLTVDELFGLIKKTAQIKINEDDKSLLDLEIKHKASDPFKALKNHLNQTQSRVLFSVESKGRREALLELLTKASLRPNVVDSWNGFIESDADLNITVAPLVQGLLLPEVEIITEVQLFGEHVHVRRQKLSRVQDPDFIVKNLTELAVGAPVVHIDHGVGRYQGLELLTTGEISAEYLCISYDQGNKLYVPVSSLHLISRYSGNDLEHAPINRLGSKQWEKAKRKAAKRIRDVAAELLDIYARREARQGIAFKKPDDDYTKFAQDFPFDETPDQADAIQSVIADMIQVRPMDRLVCGDVGFGKTEVAMRAAFVAVQSGKQVAILVPTTLLAEQHRRNFKDRFADWPVKIDALSRFRTQKEQKQLVQELKEGQLDIIIGTHRLLQKDVAFKRLGLLIIDEEHRFGVRHKEKVKSMRSEVDILTLTATPIPRTLNMAMASIRDLSIIATPPLRRLSVKTFVHDRSDITIQEAITREIMRGGQVYFLHNKVDSIHRIADEIQKLVPEAKIGIGHGQMPERQLEQVMSDFYHQKFNVFLCTTIIESGIDIPSANTIIIDRADHFGLAQLHQLRGRVGRSHHQAYAYLFTPGRKLITSDAKKRLDAISALEDLGSGFLLATHDLEIRGAGELLGEGQSGHLHEIGFSLYMELLELAVKSLKEGVEPDFEKPLQSSTEIDLHLPALIPHDYLPDVHMRLSLYKRIANTKNKTEIRELKVEMIDRFGLLPESVTNLFALTELRQLAEKLNIHKIDANAKKGTIYFHAKPNIDPEALIDLIQKEASTYRLFGSDKFQFNLEKEAPSARIEFIGALLKKLQHNGES